MNANFEIRLSAQDLGKLLGVLEIARRNATTQIARHATAEAIKAVQESVKYINPAWNVV